MKKLLIVTLCILMFGCPVYGDTSQSGMRKNISGLEFVAEMAPGVNLWNSLDAYCHWLDTKHSETCWGRPVTTKEMIDGIKRRGFKTLRIPVTWYNHMGPAPEYTIEKWWMDRVEDVANYAFDNDMYVIINIHHDDYDKEKPGTWLTPNYKKRKQTLKQLEKLWAQIATRFKDYGDYLVFETMNEPRDVGGKDEWNGGTKKHREVVNQLNLAAVNTIRATGGNNASRFIMVPQVGAHGIAAVEDMNIPNDDERIIVSIHNYNPFEFSLADPGVNTWGTDAEKKQVVKELKSYYDTFIAKGRPVILGEWGASDKNNLKDRIKYYEAISAACKKYQITPIAWIYDYDRTKRTWKNPALEDAILDSFLVQESSVTTGSGVSK